MTRKSTLSIWPPVRIIYKDSFKNFFQMTILLLPYVVTISGQLHFTRNYFFTGNVSAEDVLPQSKQFDTTVTFSEQLLLQNSYFLEGATFSEHSLRLSSYFLKISTYSERNLYRLLLLVNRQLFRQLVFQNRYFSEKQQYEHLLFRKSYLFRVATF